MENFEIYKRDQNFNRTDSKDSLLTCVRILDFLINRRRHSATQTYVYQLPRSFPYESMELISLIDGCSFGFRNRRQVLVVEHKNWDQCLEFSRGLLLAFVAHYQGQVSFRVESVWSMVVGPTRWPREDFIPAAKFVTAAWIASYLDQELPEKPDFLHNIYVCDGGMKRFIRNIVRRRHEGDLPFMVTVLQGVKRACATAPDEFLHLNLLKHRKRMDEPRKTIPALLGWVREKALSFFSDLPKFDKDLFESYRSLEVSTSSGYKVKKSEGGQRADVMRVLKEKRGEGQSFYSELHSYVGPIERDFPYLDDDLLAELIFDCADDLSGYTTTDKRLVRCETHPIAEPLKVRVITKGEPVPYYLARPAQKFLWTTLQKFPCFRHIGEPINTDSIKMLHSLNQPYICSGDYSAATDNLCIEITKCIWSCLEETVFKDVDTLLLKIWRAVLFEHEVHYPKKNKIESVVQKNGQLMGSPLSFPILCLANFFGYWISKEIYLSKELPYYSIMKDLYVNGDDILFGTTPEMYEIWKSVVSGIGFDLSVGKNYLHDSIFCINSTFFRRTLSEDRGHYLPEVLEQLSSGSLALFDPYDFEEVKWVNLGLLVGRTKLGNVSDHAPIGDYYNVVLGGTPLENRELVHGLFLRYHADRIQRQTRKGRHNIFLKKCYGGLGFDPNLYPGDVSLTDTQISYALYCLSAKGTELSKNTLIRPVCYIEKDMYKPDSVEVGQYEQRKLQQDEDFLTFTLDRKIWDEEVNFLTKTFRFCSMAKLHKFSHPSSDYVLVLPDFRKFRKTVGTNYRCVEYKAGKLDLINFPYEAVCSELLYNSPDLKILEASTSYQTGSHDREPKPYYYLEPPVIEHSFVEMSQDKSVLHELISV